MTNPIDWLPLAAFVVVASAAASALLILLVWPTLVRYAMAQPNARSSHTVPTPQGGGLAVIAAVLLVAGAAAWLAGGAAPCSASLWTTLAATAGIAIVGLLDDFHGLPVPVRFGLQCLAVAIVIAALPAECRVVPMLPLIAERALLFVAVLWFVNLTNFMDGIDWMTVSEVVPVTAALAILGGVAILPPGPTIVALAVLGATIGFAPFNRPVARLFLGDVGSLSIGLLLAWLLVLLAGGGHLAAALLLPLYYLADATITLVRRAANGERLSEAHRSHFYQRATNGGFSVREINGNVFTVNTGLAALAMATVAVPTTPVAIAALATGAALVAWLLVRFERGKSPSRTPRGAT